MEHDIMPVVVLTTVEAQAVIEKLPARYRPAPKPKPKPGGLRPKPLSEEEARKMAIQNPEHYFWRSDKALGRNIFVLVSNDPEQPSDDDPLLGTMSTSAIAENVVHTHNAVLAKYGRRYLDTLQQAETT